MLSSERLTVKAAEAINAALELARKNGNPVIQDLHLLSALLDQNEGMLLALSDTNGAESKTLLTGRGIELGRIHAHG
jgi:ATP-dependent Clp protease ATP-binding subunit ClpB